MKPIRRLLAVTIILALGALACSLSFNASNQPATSQPQPTDLSVALTLAVQTI